MEDIRPLSRAKKGQFVTVKTFSGGRNFKEKLINLGILPGIKIEVLSNNNGGPLILRVKEAKIVLGHGMAEKILVS